MADKVTEVVTSSQVKPVAENKVTVAPKVPAVTYTQTQIDFFVQNGYPFCEKCNQQIYTDENRLLICSISDCPKKAE